MHRNKWPLLDRRDRSDFAALTRVPQTHSAAGEVLSDPRSRIRFGLVSCWVTGLEAKP